MGFDTPKVFLDQMLAYCYSYAVRNSDYKMMLEIAKVMSENGMTELEIVEGLI